MKETSYADFGNNKNLRVHHQKRERAVFYDDDFYYKLWVPNWEHSKVVRNAFKVGYYDSNIVPAFDSMITSDNIDLGYKIRRGKVIGGSQSSWKTLIDNSSQEQRIEFTKHVLNKSMQHRCIVSDMCPANVILWNGKLSLIDLEGLASFDWFFSGHPEKWEAQNRNLKKYPTPLWRDMSKYLRAFLEECVNIKYDKDINSIKNFLEVHTMISNL